MRFSNDAHELAVMHHRQTRDLALQHQAGGILDSGVIVDGKRIAGDHLVERDAANQIVKFEVLGLVARGGWAPRRSPRVTMPTSLPFQQSAGARRMLWRAITCNASGRVMVGSAVIGSAVDPVSYGRCMHSGPPV